MQLSFIMISNAPGSVTGKIFKKSNTPRDVAENKGTVAIDEGCQAPASVALVGGVDKPDEVVKIVKQSSSDAASVVCEVSGLVEGGDTPENNLEMQSSGDSSVVSRDTLTDMFDMATVSTDDNAGCSVNSASIRIHADRSKKLIKKLMKANKKST